jgi:hypothetical protein
MPENAYPYFAGVTPATAEAPPTSGGKYYIPRDVWNQAMDNFTAWKFDVNAGGYELNNISRITFSDGVTVSPGIISNEYDFAAQTPGGSLVIGSNTITLTPVPYGVSGANADHYLYIANGTGAAEAVLITGGTAVSGGASGTVTFTCANTHSGAWTISSATAGIKEAEVVAGAAGGGIVHAPASTHAIHAPIVVNHSYVNIQGVGPGATVLLADNAVSPVIQVGTASIRSDRSTISDLTVARDVSGGDPPAGTIGIHWRNFNYSSGIRLVVNRHAICEQFGIIGGPLSTPLGHTSIDVNDYEATESYLDVSDAIDVWISAAHLGTNGGEGYAPAQAIAIRGSVTDTFRFTDSTIIGTHATDLIPVGVNFIGYTATNGVFYFDHMNCERMLTAFKSDSATTIIQELNISNSRWPTSDPATDKFFDFHANTSVVNLSLTNNSIGALLTIPKVPAWTRITGNLISSGTATLTGASGTSSLAFTGNTIFANVTFAGVYDVLSIAGNTWVGGAMTVTATGAAAGSIRATCNTVNGTPIADITPALVWNAVTFESSWVNENAAYPTKYMLDGQRVTIRGMAKDGTMTDATVVFTLPAGYRPAQIERFAISYDDAGTEKTGALVVSTSGTCAIYGITANTQVSFSGVSFYTA